MIRLLQETISAKLLRICARPIFELSRFTHHQYRNQITQLKRSDDISLARLQPVLLPDLIFQLPSGKRGMVMMDKSERLRQGVTRKPEQHRIQSLSLGDCLLWKHRHHAKRGPQIDFIGLTLQHLDLSWPRLNKIVRSWTHQRK